MQLPLQHASSPNPSRSARGRIHALCALAILGLTDRGLAEGLDSEVWDRFRGPNGSGVSSAAGLPSRLGTASLLWQVPAPLGVSSPVIWGHRAYITGYESDHGLVIALDLQDGSIVWRKSLPLPRLEKKSKPNDPASSTPAVDQSGLYVLLSGLGLISFDHFGQERWRAPLDAIAPPHGMAASPVLASGKVILVADQVRDSYIAAFDSATGSVKWRTPRPSFVGGYATPIQHAGRIVTSGPVELMAYDPATGLSDWRLPKMGVMPVASPISVGDRLFLYNDAVPPYEQLANLQADRDGDGRISPEEFPDPSFQDAVRAIDQSFGHGDGAVDRSEWDGALRLMQALNTCVAVQTVGDRPEEAWRVAKLLADSASPLHYRGVLYLLKNGGVLTALDPASGAVIRQARVPGLSGNVFASPVAADGKLFLLSEPGNLVVLEAGREWSGLDAMDLHESCYATPAIAAGLLLVRSERTEVLTL